MGISFSKPTRILNGWIGTFLLASLTACGGQSLESSSDIDAGREPVDASSVIEQELDRNLFLDELSEDELLELCEWMVGIQGGPHTVDCGDGLMVTIDPVEDCLAQPHWPHCRVGLYADCVDTQALDLCAEASLECEEFYACVYGT